jgi:hypothetical protein
MPLPSRFFPVLVLAAAAATSAVGCVNKEELSTLDATIKSDGYALFAVNNEQQQRNDFIVKVKNPDPNSTYVLFYSPDTPGTAGWFLFDPAGRERCGGDLGEHCKVGEYGYMVDYKKAGEGAQEIILRDDRCGCDANNTSKHWTGHWAVMRVERTNKENQVTVDVWAKAIKDFANDVSIDQLQ